MTKALIEAAKHGDVAEVQAALESGTDIEAADELGWTALRMATAKGHIPVVRCLLTSGAQVAKDQSGYSPLMAAAFHGHTEVADVLLDAGAEVDTEHTGVAATALMLAANCGRVEVVRLLLRRGAATEIRNNRGQTALMAAAICGENEIVNLLLDNGAEVDAQDNDGETALTLARHEYLHEEHPPWQEETVAILERASKRTET